MSVLQRDMSLLCLSKLVIDHRLVVNVSLAYYRPLSCHYFINCKQQQSNIYRFFNDRMCSVWFSFNNIAINMDDRGQRERSVTNNNLWCVPFHTRCKLAHFKGNESYINSIISSSEYRIGNIIFFFRSNNDTQLICTWLMKRIEAWSCY